jgi:dihydropteroate synthase
MKSGISQSINMKGHFFSLEEPQIMGILNCTPDSFHSESRVQASAEIANKIEAMIYEGATILDFGGQSTRPGATQVGVQEEIDRVIPAIELAKKHYPDVHCSIDTFYGKVAEAAIHAGANIINDISAGSMDASILDIAAKTKVPYVLMHMQGKPSDMQEHPSYKNVTQEVYRFFQEKLAQLKVMGIEEVIIDLGFGFGKNAAHNFELLRNMELFHQLHKPILTGISRKSMIYKTLGTDAANALNGTSVLHAWALERGSQILRVHDVKEAKEAIQLWKALNKINEPRIVIRNNFGKPLK